MKPILTIATCLVAATTATAVAQIQPSIQPSIQPTLQPAPADANPTTRSPSAGLDEGAAKRKLEGDGYRDIRGMTSNPDGTWSGHAVRDNTEQAITIDSSGNIRTR
jgi:hypothetical protein